MNKKRRIFWPFKYCGRSCTWSHVYKTRTCEERRRKIYFIAFLLNVFAHAFRLIIEQNLAITGISKNTIWSFLLSTIRRSEPCRKKEWLFKKLIIKFRFFRFLINFNLNLLFISPWNLRKNISAISSWFSKKLYF